MSDLIKRNSIRNLYSCLNPNDRVLVGQVLIDIDATPSAEVPTTMTGVIDAIREAEYRGCMKAVEERPKGEWASVLAELHEQFDVLENELRKASAEMSAGIREYVDGLKYEPHTDGYMTAEQTADYRNMLDNAEHKVYGNVFEDEPQRDCGTCKHKWDGEGCKECFDSDNDISNYEPQGSNTCFNCKWGRGERGWHCDNPKTRWNVVDFDDFCEYWQKEEWGGKE